MAAGRGWRPRVRAWPLRRRRPCRVSIGLMGCDMFRGLVINLAASTLALSIFLPAASKAQIGFVCAQDNGLIQKYRLEGERLIPEGDAFSRVLERAAKALGISYQPSIVWRVIVNNPVGIIAIIASAEERNGPEAQMYMDTLMIERYTGRFRNISGTITSVLKDFKTGNCVSYP